MTSSSNNRLFITLLLAFVVFTVFASFYRFVIAQDFMVTYEIDCDPQSAYCYVGCEDDECLEEYYYQEIERYAPTLLNLCGSDITDCAAALSCMSDEMDCSVYSCDPQESPEECLGPNI